MTPKQQAMVDAVKAHAQAHYDEDGWDYVVETYDDAEIAEAIHGCTKPEYAIIRMGRIIKVRDDVRKDVIAAGGGEG